MNNPSNPVPPPAPGGSTAPIANTENRKLITGICAILLGQFGVHKFLLGYNTEGIIMLVATLVIGVVTCGIGAIATFAVGVIEGVIYLTKTDADFDQTYIHNKKPWF